MLIRVVSACLAGLLLVACDDNGKDVSKHADSAMCKGLNKTDCTANRECDWNAEKDRCRNKKVPDEDSEAASPEQPPASEPTPSPEAAPTPEAPETPAPETTPPQ